MQEPMILVAKNLKKTYRLPRPIEVLSDVSLSLAFGKSIAICGRSGEGKTTLLHLLGTLEMADSGTLEINGTLVSRENLLSLRKQSIGFIFQSFHLLEDLTALENVLMPAKVVRRFFSHQEGLELLSQVGLLQRANFPVKLLSGGERQRVAIARALCNSPQLILADEPSGNLDKETAKEIGELLFSLVKEKKKSLILATHDLTLASMCDRTVCLSGGKLGY